MKARIERAGALHYTQMSGPLRRSSSDTGRTRYAARFWVV